jgi:hypothetical protein
MEDLRVRERAVFKLVVVIEVLPASCSGRYERWVRNRVVHDGATLARYILPPSIASICSKSAKKGRMGPSRPMGKIWESVSPPFSRLDLHMMWSSECGKGSLTSSWAIAGAWPTDVWVSVLLQSDRRFNLGDDENGLTREGTKQV